MADETFDLTVIGAGPAGYVAAIRGAQLGFKTACIEKDKTLGGTCLNVGCIPSKALLESSEHYYQAKTKFQKHGIVVGDLKVDLEQMMKRKQAVVRQLTNGISGLFKKNNIQWLNGKATLLGNKDGVTTIQVESASGTKTVESRNVLLATGSIAAGLPFLPFDGKRILSSTEALDLKDIPKHLVVIGGGVIGLELGSVWLRLGSKVTVVEFLDRIVPGADRQLTTELQKALAKQGMEFRLATKCLGAQVREDSVVVEAEEMATANKFQLECDYVLVATGRRPYSQGLGLEKLGIQTDRQGRVRIDEHFRTEIPGIYAVGDLVDGPMLAHKAEEEGIAAVEIMAGQKGHVNYEAIPSVVYTWPELASVGASEEELKEKNIPYKTGTFPFMANGRAKAMEETEGLVKVIAHAETDRILGVHIVGARAGDMIAEAAAVIEFKGTAEDLARTTHAHPSLSEIVKEAALAVGKRQIHM